MRTLKIQGITTPFNYLLCLLLSFFLFSSCEKDFNESSLNVQDASAKKTVEAAPYTFEGTNTVFDISATPDGSILVGLNTEVSPATDEEPAVIERSIKLIKNGEISDFNHLDVETNIQGIESIGTGSAFFTTAGTDLAMNGELYRASKGKVRMVADLAEFERMNDPDAYEGIQWKNQECEFYGGFSAGPQNNPYKVTAFDGETALVADAAGNTVLQATTEGHIDWKAILTPPVINGEYMVLFNRDEIDCYAQPVPTSVAIGPDGYVYVGELTGEVPVTELTPDGLPKGLSRIWKFPADANNVVCSELDGSDNCHLLIDGLTSVIDIEIGPDGLLYVVEYDENSWLGLFTGALLGGTVNVYDLDGELIRKAEGLSLPSAITIDKKGNIWLLENNIIAPTVRLMSPDEFVEAS